MPNPIDIYPLVKYTHFLAIVAAVVGASYLHFSVVRLRSAATVDEARTAFSAVVRFAPRMMIFALALFATGAYLVQLRWAWSSGWVSAGILGLVSLPATSAIFLKPRL